MTKPDQKHNSISIMLHNQLTNHIATDPPIKFPITTSSKISADLQHSFKNQRKFRKTYKTGDGKIDNARIKLLN